MDCQNDFFDLMMCGFVDLYVIYEYNDQRNKEIRNIDGNFIGRWGNGLKDDF